MNKTVTINLSGIIFHIDETAYEILKKYLETLKKHFEGTQGRDEIIADIESRIAEIFSQRIAEGQSAILMDDVDAVMKEMGKPEDITDDNEEAKTETGKTETTFHDSETRKRFFRNPDDKILAGVCGGVAAYFDIDPIWLRLAFVLAVFFGGSGLLVYIILWIIIPKANTVSERMQMRGEKVNISNIEKSVKEEMEEFSKRMKDLGKEINSDEFKNRARSQGDKLLAFLQDVFGGLFRFVARMFGFIITILSLGVLVMLMFGIFASIGAFHFLVPLNVLNLMMSSSQSTWLILGLILTVSIPFILLLLNGIKLLFKVKLDLKKIGAIMLIFWLSGIGILVLDGFAIARNYRSSGTVTASQNLNVKGNTLHLFANPTWKENYDVEFFDMIQPDNSDSVFCPMVHFDLEPSTTDSFSLITKFVSRGSTAMEARILASEINYTTTTTDSSLIIPRWFVVNDEHKYRGQQVKMVLKIPVGKMVSIPKQFEYLLDNVSNLDDLGDWEMTGHTFIMTANGLKCVDCTADELNHKTKEEQIDIDLHHLHQHIEQKVQELKDSIK